MNILKIFFSSFAILFFSSTIANAGTLKEFDGRAVNISAGKLEHLDLNLELMVR